MAGESNLDTNLENYSDNELLSLFDITSHDNYDAIMKKTNDYIDNFPVNDENDEKVKEFLVKAQEKIREKYESTDRSVKNPVNREIHHKFLSLDSRFRQNYLNINTETGLTSSDEVLNFVEINNETGNYTVNLSETLKNVTKMKFNSVHIPYSWYNVYAPRNTFYLTMTTPTLANVSLDITPGNYSIGDLITAINDKINSIVGATVTMPVFEQNPNTGKIQIVNPDTNSVTISFVENATNLAFTSQTKVDNNIGTILGFRKLTYTIPTNGSVSGEGFPEPVRTKFLLLEINDYNTNHVSNKLIHSNNENNHQSNKNINQNFAASPNYLAHIPFTPMTFGDLFVYTNDSDYLNERVYFGPVDIERISVRLLDDSGNQVDLNGAEWSLTILVEHQYQNS